MSYLNSVTIIGFVGADPEQRQARNNNGSTFTVLSVATQRSWKNTDDEWASKTEWHRVCVIWNLQPRQIAATVSRLSRKSILCPVPQSPEHRSNQRLRTARDARRR